MLQETILIKTQVPPKGMPPDTIRHKAVADINEYYFNTAYDLNQSISSHQTQPGLLWGTFA
jgi:hypothetical protein